MRGKSGRKKRPAVTPSAIEKQALKESIRDAKRAYAKGLASRIARIKRTQADKENLVKSVLRKFRPKKSDRGRIVFIGARGGRISGATRRKGFGLYISKLGRKSIIRQFDRKSGHVERTPVPRKLTSFDASRVRSKSAKREFLTAKLNPAVRAILRKKGKGISQAGTRYAGKIQTNKFYANSDAVSIMARALVKASNSQKSKRDFLVSIGISVIDGNGRRHWVELQRRFSRQDGQTAMTEEVRSYFGREIYAFLAKELSDRNLVLQGSARHIGRLKENRGKKRSEWRKDGFLWQGHDQNDVTIESVEYRFDQLTLTN